LSAELVPNNSLITATPEEGRALAIKLARFTVRAIQPDAEVRQRLRAAYAENPDTLTAAAHVVAVEFATVAAANDYWRTAQPEVTR
jgi:hypothetical protein